MASLSATDLLDLRVFPLFDSHKIAFAGVISNSGYKATGTGLRAKLSGLRSRWLASSTVIVESGMQKISASIKDGEFSGVMNVASFASFTVSVYYDSKKLYQEQFNFPDKADFIVVSDIDDTILVTEVTSRVKMVYNSLFKDVNKRKPVDGTPEFYRAMSRGETGMGIPHFIYLSSSPAFLSRFLKAFLVHNNFPPGTLVLKKSLTSGDHGDHKTGWLKEILAKYTDKPLLLFGDSGEKDPVIYRDFVESTLKSPVKGIVIHEVASKKDKILSLKIPFIYWSNIEALKLNMYRNGLLK
ncbi:MAG: DUF2183 domain-containing protein [Candidatus Riflebacteria bacterium]|nr:DUF2183 domain-containing protein [Candidatus Riflebacteria bacterium]